MIILFTIGTIGLLMLLVQTIRIAFSLLKIACYIIALIGCLIGIVLCGFGLFCQWIVRRLKRGREPEPVVTVNISLDDEDVPTVDLPRKSFHRLRG
jgi:hypothetical protein